jgi:hypothetical protein
MKVFISYSHQESDWVRNDLVPVLEAGGAEVLVDHKLFKAGRTVLGQMDSTQDQADRHVLCLSAAYACSDMCRHEFRRAVATDPGFRNGSVLPLRLDDTPLPPEIAAPDPISLDFRDRHKVDAWKLLLDACDAALGLAATSWLAARDAAARELERFKSANLVVPRAGVRWRPLISDLQHRIHRDLVLVDLHDGRTEFRDGLLSRILSELKATVAQLPHRPTDLSEFTDRILGLRRSSRVCICHFEEVERRRATYDASLFKGLRWLVTHEQRPLTLLIVSRVPLTALQPDGPDDSDLASQLTNLELR